jgi:PKD repeat protein
LPDTAYVGQSISFTSCTNRASSYYWIFGDSHFATTDSAVHVYTAPGVYNGSLTTDNGPNNIGNTKPFTIIVLRASNVWTFRGITDTSSFAQAVGDTIQTTNFTASNSNNISNLLFIFSALPTVSASYQVVSDFFATPSASQVAIYLTTPSGKIYGSTGNDHVNANITVSGGKVFISLPSAMMANANNPSDSAALTATVRQTE